METSIDPDQVDRLRLAWFRAAPPQHSVLDDTAALIAELRGTHEIGVFTAREAHDFVWRDFRAPYDLCVCELDNTPAHQFIWPYVLHYGGVLLLRSLTLHDSRAQALAREQRAADYIAEVTFDRGRAPRHSRPPQRMSGGSWPMLRAPLLASRAVVVPHAAVAAALEDAYPGARVRCAPTGVPAGAAQANTWGQPSDGGAAPHARTRFGLPAGVGAETVQRAIQRARDGGAAAELVVDPSPERLLQRCDVVLDLRWPVFGEPHTLALAGMAAARPVVVIESETTADWPALDPQTWQPRGIDRRAAVVSIDPRDEEHSLVLAVRRLSGDADLRAQLGAAAQEWWRTHATVRHAAEAWQRILAEAASLPRPARPADWPAHLTADGTECARQMLADFGVAVDFL